MNEDPRKVIAIIPAKGYSRRVARKNMRLFHGKPLIHYTVQCALESREVSEVVVSTDSEEIQAYCQRLGAAVPFLRPAEQSADQVHASVPILDMLERLGGAARYAYCVSLPPTFPLRRPETIDTVVRLSKAHGRNVLSVTPTGKIIHHMRTISPEGSLVPVAKEAVYNFQTQDAAQLVYINGAAYCAPVEALLEHRTFQYGAPIPHLMDLIESMDIDTEADFLLAERLAGATESFRLHA